MTSLSVPPVVAIDGPSGSGKSSVSRELARRLGVAYLDTGAMYRAVTWSALQAGIELSDADAVAAHAEEFDLAMGIDPEEPGVFVGDDDVTQAVRETRISAVVSVVAAQPRVREQLIAMQRDIIDQARQEELGIVAEGRDITTVVAPDADVRILLVASEDARLRRRAAQLHGDLGADADEVLAQTRDEVVRRDADDAKVTAFLEPAPGVILLDTSELDFEESVQAALTIVLSTASWESGESGESGESEEPDDGFDESDASEDDADDDIAGLETVSVGAGEEGDVERALRAGLGEFDLSAGDRALLDRGDLDEDDADEEAARPVVAIIGRPNVGKSTLVNRILGRREAVVEDVPGVTRDRVAYDAEWSGRRFTLVDTGGWEVDASGIHLRVAEQAEVAVELADVVMFVVDATVGATDTDEAVVKMLRRSRKPVVLVANKVDDQRSEADAAMLWSLGLGQPWPVSALHGRGSGDVLDAVLEVLPTVSSVSGAYRRGGPRRVALLGRPNVGKSSMLNKLAGSERVVVDDVAGTTRDPVDEYIELAGKTWRFVDTAGIRRRVHQTRGADFYASLRTRTALEKAEVAVVLMDVSESLTEQDVRVVQQVVDAGRALVLAFNKWDLLDEERRYYLEREIARDLVQIQWAPRVNVSARTGRHMERLVPALETALESWDTRIPTARLNAFLGEVVAAHPHPVRGGKQPRILFATQASTRPPRFVVFASGFLEASYRRFLERRLREQFGFTGSPIELSVRVREKRRKR
ncbi:bifunctional cytidylate kinase/GTPase Der [Piscicoccus intestinalis]|uniref:bifunctional cytidylate kinase/GTPase Der n=1 Tax=Piscicoccus intestinalis TaxID=746033 RepID=UPI00083850CC|nr:bifunctional cytidylate kinase/GTPase Der [Piscicoccus intestinalis]